MDILFTIGGMSILVLPFVIGRFIDKKAKKPKKSKKHPETKLEMLERVLPREVILDAQQGFGSEELLKEFYYTD